MWSLSPFTVTKKIDDISLKSDLELSITENSHTFTLLTLFGLQSSHLNKISVNFSDYILYEKK